MRYRHNDTVTVDGEQKQVRKQKCVKLADYCGRYRCKRDLNELVQEKMAAVCQAAKCPESGRMFTSYVEGAYLPYVPRTKKPSTYSGRKTYWLRYIRPRLEK